MTKPTAFEEATRRFLHEQGMGRLTQKLAPPFHAVAEWFWQDGFAAGRQAERDETTRANKPYVPPEDTKREQEEE